MNEMLHALWETGTTLLHEEDPALYALLEAEYQRQMSTLVLVASCSVIHPSVLVCEGTVTVNVTAEGYPGRRYHAGCEVIDGIEQMAIDRACQAFKAQYANVQPHSATTANYIVMASLLRPGDTILGMELQYGGHLTHGAKVSFSGQYFQAVGYGLTEDEQIDYAQVRRLAHEIKPRLIICGATAYPRTIDFQRFREIADEVGAYVLADISHTAGLVVTGRHPSPIDHAHFTTTCTHKQLYGPRGGLILMGKDYAALAPDGRQTLAEMMQRAVFPFMQGAPILNAITAKARALSMAQTPQFAEVTGRVVHNARAMAAHFMDLGYHVVSGGSDNHIVLLDLGSRAMSGLVAELALEECGIIVNKNRVPGDRRSALLTSGIRLGTNTVALRAMGQEEMIDCADLVHHVLCSIEVVNEREYRLPAAVRQTVRARVRQLCLKFPIPTYPTTY